MAYLVSMPSSMPLNVGFDWTYLLKVVKLFNVTNDLSAYLGLHWTVLNAIFAVFLSARNAQKPLTINGFFVFHGGVLQGFVHALPRFSGIAIMPKDWQDTAFSGSDPHADTLFCAAAAFATGYG